MLAFSETLKSLRKEKNLTQEQLGDVLGVSAQAISRWENGASLPDITMLPAIAAYFEVSADTLLGIRRRTVRQKMLCFQVRYQQDAERINQYLDDGWLVKELHTHPLDEGQHPEGVVILEKTDIN